MQEVCLNNYVDTEQYQATKSPWFDLFICLVSSLLDDIDAAKDSNMFDNDLEELRKAFVFAKDAILKDPKHLSVEVGD